MKDLLKLTTSTTTHYFSLWITLLGAAGSIFLLRRRLSLPLPPRKPGPSPALLLLLRLSVPGLRNLGNNCFLNAILQALASSEVVLSYLRGYERDKVVSSFTGMEESCPTLPLTEALIDLLSELSILNNESSVASPRHVMLALEQYAKHFNLSLQQDAAEAFSHLIDALQEERSICCENLRSYKESFASTLGMYMDGSPLKRIVESDSKKEGTSLYCWKPQFQFPIEGTMGSMLTCQKCGFQFSVMFQSFHDVPLSPPQWPDGNIEDGCSLESCLQRFTAPECITNVRCSQCSHVLILSLLKQRVTPNKVLIQRIEQCTFGDDCPCEDLVKEEGEIWRNVYVSAWKQLRFGQCPQLLCCQVQRAVISRTGELMKYTHHVSFPLALDLSPYLMMSSYSQEKLSSSFNPLTLSREADIIQKYFLQKRSIEMFGRSDPSFYKRPLSTDDSNSDDTHLSIYSGSEDLSSDASSESMNGQSSEDNWKESSDHRFQPEDCSSSNRYGDPSFCGLLDGALPHLRFQNLRDSSVLFDPNMIRNQTYDNYHMDSNSASMLAFADPGQKVVFNGSDKLLKDYENPNGVRKWMYELVSVVVHSGSPKAGHYIVYRRAKFKRAAYTGEAECLSQSIMAKENPCEACNDHLDTSMDKSCFDALNKNNDIGDSLRKFINQDELIIWFRVSDSCVDMVSEAEVLMAQASLLFYERQICEMK